MSWRTNRYDQPLTTDQDMFEERLNERLDKIEKLIEDMKFKNVITLDSVSRLAELEMREVLNQMRVSKKRRAK